MDKAQVEKCSECHLPKTQDGLYSLTQWISVCSCGLIDDSDEQRETVDFCVVCNKRVIKARKGSFTQWVFRSDLCGCENPSIVKRKTKAELSDSTKLFEDESQEEIEIDIVEEKFPKERFKPIGILGEGTSGSVYLCRDRILNKRVAVKCLKYLSNHLIVSFQQEAKINTKLDHPNIAKVIDFGVYKEEKPYMVVEYIDGLSLEHHLETHGAPDLPIALSVLLQIAEAIAYAHRQKVFHRDLKSANILFMDNKDAKPVISVIDFGLALVKASETDDSDENVVIGTPGYMAPDTVQGLKFDERSEIYSFGCVAFELLTGKLPFIAETSLDVLNKHAFEKAPLISEVADHKGFPEELQYMVDKCLEKDPDDRFQSMEEVIESLKVILDIESTKPGWTTDVFQIKDDSKSNKVPKLVRTAAIALIGLLVALSIGSYFNSTLVNKKIEKKKIVLKTEKNLISPQTELEQQKAYKIVGGRVTFSSKEGFMHPDNIIAFEDEDMKQLIGKNYPSVSFYGASCITGSGLKYLVNEPIERLSVDHSTITADSFKYISQFKKLKCLYSEYNNAPDEAIEKLDKLEALVELTLNGNRKITDRSIPMIIEKFPNLVELSLLGTSVTDSGVVKLAKMKNLRNLYLNSTIITDKSVQAVCKPPMSTLLLSRTRITDKSLLVLAGCKTLQETALAECSLVTNKGLLKLRKARPRLKINTQKVFDDFSSYF